MDLQQEDIQNVYIEDDILSIYLDKLNLEDIQKEILVSDEIAKNDKTNTSEDLSINKDVTINIKLENAEMNSSNIKNIDTELKEENKDVNGNEEVSFFPNLNLLFDKLELSDSENEDDECKDEQKLRERAPIRPPKTSSKNKKTNFYHKQKKEHDKAEFNPEKLSFWAGSYVVVDASLAENSNVTNISYDNLPTVFTTAEPSVYATNNDALFDYRANSFGSPESGYETSNSISGCSPPPRFSMPGPSSLDENLENVIDGLVELQSTTDCVSFPTFNQLSDIDEKDYVGKVLVNYLKDEHVVQDGLSNKDFTCTSKISLSAMNSVDLNSSDQCLLPNNKVQQRTETDAKDYEDEIHFHNNSSDLQNELSNVRYIDKNINTVPISNDVDLNISNVEPPSASNQTQQKINIPKKLYCKELPNKARIELHKFLSYDELLTISFRIYKKAFEDKNSGKEVNIIYIEDEMEGTSDNRTNLHLAVLNSNLEEIYALVEIHKEYEKPFSDLSNRDKHGKTALDYALQNNMPLVVDYLKENMACQSLNI